MSGEKVSSVNEAYNETKPWRTASQAFPAAVRTRDFLSARWMTYQPRLCKPRATGEDNAGHKSEDGPGNRHAASTVRSAAPGDVSATDGQCLRTAAW